jgi:hypothetical protein
MAKKIYELSTLTPDELEARTWEAFLIINAVISSATPAGIDKMNVDKEARWGDQIRKEGLMSALKPEVVFAQRRRQAADHQDRPRERARQPEPRHANPPAGADVHPARGAGAPDRPGPCAGRRGVRRVHERGQGKSTSSVVRPLSATWFKEPWLTIFPPDGRRRPCSS